MSDSEPVEHIADSRDGNSPHLLQDAPQVIGDRYQVLEVIGRGGMGTVLKASHLNLSKIVAIKLLNPGMLVDELSKGRFEVEAKAGSKLSHPNLVAVFDYGFTGGGDPYLVMEYVEGESLDQMIARLGRLDAAEFLNVFSQICKALQYIHNSGIIHRDLKPSNIMIQSIGEDRYARLLDFGIAKVVSDSGYTAQHLTATGSVFGSPPYMSPEQCQGNKTDARSDIYSLGCVMYECLTGIPPFKGENALQTIFKQVSESAEPIKSSNHADMQISAIISRCLEKDPDRRFNSVGELLSELSRVSTSEASTGKSNGPLSSSFGRHTTASSAPSFGSNSSIADASSIARKLPYDAGMLDQIGKGTTGSHHTSIVDDGAREQLKQLQEGKFKKSKDIGAQAGRVRAAQAPGPLFGWGAATFIIFVISALVIGFPSGVDSVQQSVQGLFLAGSLDRAEQLLSSGKYEEAEAAFKSALAHVGGNAEAEGRVYSRIGRAAYLAGDNSDALKSFALSIGRLKSVAEESEPNRDAYLDAVYGRGQALARQSSFIEAEKCFAEARALSDRWAPDLLRADILLASAENMRKDNLKQSLKHYDHAIDAYQRSTKKAPDRLATALVQCAELREELGYASEAARQSQVALDVIGSSDKLSGALKADLETRARSVKERLRVKTAVSAPVSGTNNVIPALPAVNATQYSPAVPQPMPYAGTSPAVPQPMPYAGPSPAAMNARFEAVTRQLKQYSQSAR